MSLVVYLDGSKGKSKRFLTLAAVFADDSAWTKVRQAWECVLDKSGASYSHMRELLSPDGPFSGWDEIRKQDFVRNLFSSLTVADPSEFMASSLTIDLSEYGNLADGKRNVKPAEAICVDYCITDV